jgi:DNA-binding transcriptional ArsR family regulator
VWNGLKETVLAADLFTLGRDLPRDKRRVIVTSLRLISESAQNVAARTVKRNTKAAVACAERMKALSEPLRLQIIDVLREGPQSVTQLSDRLGAEMVTTSHHLKILKNAGLVERKRDGRWIVYRLNEDVFRERAAAAKFDILDFGCCRLEIPK